MENTSINFLVLTLDYGYVKCYRWGKWGEGYTGFLCIIFATFSESNYFKITSCFKN